MAGDGGEGKGEVVALREALQRQTVAVEQLRAELEKERQAAASGADEALAMILRLQAEKAADRMEAEQFRRIADEKIQHDEGSVAFLKAVAFHQEMEINSLKCQLLARKHRVVSVCPDDPFAPASGEAFDLPWLRKLSKNGVSSKRNASLPAIQLEELCSELDVVGHEARPVRTTSDVAAEVTRKEWLKSNVSYPAPPRRLNRSVSHRLQLAPTRCSVCSGSVHDMFHVPESLAAHVPVKSGRTASPEIISEEDDSISTRRNDDNSRSKPSEADIDQIKGSLRNLETEFGRMREISVSRDNAQAKMLTELRDKLDAIQNHMLQKNQQNFRSNHPQLGEGSSSKGRNYPQSELLMNHFIEAMMYVS